MEVICNCGENMECNLYEPDQDESYEGWDCLVCGASFYGVVKIGTKPLPITYGEEEEGDD